MIKAILFDLDGTITDSEPIHKTAWERLLKEKGYNFRDDLLFDCIGLNDKNMEKLLKKELGEDFEIEPCRPLATKYANEIIEKQGMCIKSGFYELSDYLKAHNIKSIITTSSPKADALHELSCCGIQDRFGGIINGDCVTYGKPFPEPYEKARELAGVSKDECLVVEDSMNGVKSAVAAGIRCVYIKDMKDIPADVKATAYVELKSLDEVIGIIEKLAD